MGVEGEVAVEDVGAQPGAASPSRARVAVEPVMLDQMPVSLALVTPFSWRRVALKASGRRG